MPYSFTPRQKMLLSRLISVCERLETKKLPIIPEEVWIFGSFIRGKKNPKDIDLIIKSSGISKEFEKFESIFSESCDLKNRLDTPKDSVLKVAKEKFSNEEFQSLEPIFSEWVVDYTWDIVFGGIMNIPDFTVNATEITTRILKKGNPRIQIFKIISTENDLSALKAESVSLVWRKNNSSIQENMQKIFSDDKIKEARIIELRNFNKQIYDLQNEIDVLKHIFKQGWIFKKNNSDYRYFEEWMKQLEWNQFSQLTPKTIADIIHNIRMAYPDTLEFEYVDEIDYSCFEDENLENIVENKRKKVKSKHEELIVLREIIYAIFHNIPDSNEPIWHKRYSLQEWVALDVLNQIQKKLVNVNRIREILEDYNLPQHNVLEQKGRGRDRFTIPETIEEEEQIVKANKKKEIDVKYRKMISPIIKKMPNKMFYYVEYGEKLNPIRINFFSGHFEQDYPASVNKIIEWCKNKGFNINQNYQSIYAELKLDVSTCQSEQEVLNKISNLLVD